MTGDSECPNLNTSGGLEKSIGQQVHGPDNAGACFITEC